MMTGIGTPTAQSRMPRIATSISCFQVGNDMTAPVVPARKPFSTRRIEGGGPYTGAAAVRLCCCDQPTPDSER
jgi:hypothetical protein